MSEGWFRQADRSMGTQGESNTCDSQLDQLSSTPLIMCCERISAMEGDFLVATLRAADLETDFLAGLLLFAVAVFWAAEVVFLAEIALLAAFLVAALAAGRALDFFDSLLFRLAMEDSTALPLKIARYTRQIGNASQACSPQPGRRSRLSSPLDRRRPPQLDEDRVGPNPD